MTIERTGIIQLAGKDATIVGADVSIGDVAKEFRVHDLDWSIVHGIANTAGRIRIIAAVPSLETAVCDREARRFNQAATGLGEDLVIEVISTDLPYTQKRWCGASGVDRVMVLSDHLLAEFGEKYGCLIKERRILRRAVFIVDRRDRIAYAAYMPTLGEEPNYDEVLKVAQGLTA